MYWSPMLSAVLPVSLPTRLSVCFSTKYASFSRAAPPGSEDLPTHPEHDAKWRGQIRALENRLGYSARWWTLGESVDGIRELVRSLIG